MDWSLDLSTVHFIIKKREVSWTYRVHHTLTLCSNKKNLWSFQICSMPEQAHRGEALLLTDVPVDRALVLRLPLKVRPSLTMKMHRSLFSEDALR